MFETVSKLTSLFYRSSDELGVFQPTEADNLPDSFRSLLAHHDHMTVTIEAWFNSLVDVRVLDVSHKESDYARKIVLVLQRDGSIVQFGIMHLDLAGLPEIVRLEIESQALPLGRIMIRHHLLRKVELCQLWQVTPAQELRSQLQLADDTPLFGRTARILVEGRPAVELLEIVKA